MMTVLRRYWESGDSLVRAGQFAQAFRQLILIALALLLPRLGLDRDEIGHWEQYQYLGYLLGFAWLTGLGQAYLARVRQLDKEAADRLTTRVLVWTIGITLMVVAVVWIGEGTMLRWLKGGETLPGWTYYLLFLLSHWPQLMYEQVLIAQGRARRLVRVSVLSNLSLAASLLLPLWMGWSWSEALPLLLLPTLVKALTLVDGKVWKKYQCTGTNGSPSLWSRALPLIGYAAIGGLVVSFDPWFVNYWYAGDDDAFALYRYGTRELPLVIAITNGIGQALLPRLSADREAGLRALRDSSRRLMHLFFPGSILLLLTSNWWWAPLFTETFAGALPLFQLFLLVGISRMIFPIVVLTATGHERALVGLGVLEFFLNVLLSWWWVKDFGLTGIVAATVVAYTLDKLLAAAWLYRREGIGINAYCHWRWLVTYSFLLLAVYWLL